MGEVEKPDKNTQRWRQMFGSRWRADFVLALLISLAANAVGAFVLHLRPVTRSVFSVIVTAVVLQIVAWVRFEYARRKGGRY